MNIFSIFSRAFQDKWLPKQHYWNTDKSNHNQNNLETSLSLPEKQIFGIFRVMFGHIDIDSNHGRDNRRSLTWIGKLFPPLVNNNKIHIDESAAHEDNLRNSQGEQISPFRSSEVIVQFDQQTKHHVNHTEYDSHFHLQTVCKLHFVCCHLPYRVNSDRKNAVCERFSGCWVNCLDYVVTTWNNSKVESKKLVVNDSTIAHEKDDHPKPDICLENYQQRNSQKHVPNITKHNPNEESKGNNVERSRVEFSVWWYTICIDNLLRHF